MANRIYLFFKKVQLLGYLFVSNPQSKKQVWDFPRGLRICLPMQGKWVQSLVGELRSHMLVEQWGPCAATIELMPQLESPCVTSKIP